VQFKVRYAPQLGGELNLSSLEDFAVSVDALNDAPPASPAWAKMDQAEVGPDGSVLATYSISAGQSAGLFGIHAALPQYHFSTPNGPRDNSDIEIPGGLMGTINLDYAYRRPSVTLLDIAATPSPRRYVSFQVRYASLSGINESMLDNSDLLVTAPDGTAMRTRLSGVVDDIDASGAVVSYYFRVHEGARGAYRVTMAARQVRDLFGRRVSGGAIGLIQFSTTGMQRRVESTPIAPARPSKIALPLSGIFGSDRDPLWGPVRAKVII
jgi:hypothetical protein